MSAAPLLKVAGIDTYYGPIQAIRGVPKADLLSPPNHQGLYSIEESVQKMFLSFNAAFKFRVPVATFQAVGHRAANCFIDVECLRLTAYEACSLLAEGRDAAVEVDIAKVWAGDTGHRVSYAAQHLHGGAGVDRGNALWRFCLWARHNEMSLGSSAQTLARLGRRCASGEAAVN